MKRVNARSRHGWRWGALGALAVFALAGAGLQASVQANAVTSTGAVQLGDYATPIVQAAGPDGIKHIDIPATIAKLSYAHVNTYAYLIYNSDYYGTASSAAITQSQWDDLPAFATAAKTAGIDVSVYLVPPSESQQAGYKPYGWDYKAWATHIAQLAVTHTNIREIVMDDFQDNVVENAAINAFAFTPLYVEQMMASARSIAPWLKFRPVMYYMDSVNNAAILPAYRTVIDGIVFPYTSVDNPSGGNTTDASKATTQGTQVGGMVKCHGGGKCLQIAFPKHRPSSAGWYAAATQRITVQAAGSHSLSFWVNDNYLGPTSGYHTIQALIDGGVVSSTDVANGTGSWHQITVDVTAALAGKTSADLTLRLYESGTVAEFGVAVQFDDIAGTAMTIGDGNFEAADPTPWVFSTANPAFSTDIVKNLDYVIMTYATRLPGEPNATTAAYVNSVVSQALALSKAGVADGSLIYCLNLTGVADGSADPTAIDSVKTLYSAY